jgi:hypothetical protein
VTATICGERPANKPRVGAKVDTVYLGKGNAMNVSLLYRIASILLVLFAAGHTVGFRQTDSDWGIDAILASMKATRFEIQGFKRTYEDFFVGFGLFVSAFLVFAAVVAWQLGGMSKATLASIPAITWGLAICLAAVAVLSWNYFFLIPILFSTVIAVCLVVAALLSRG